MRINIITLGCSKNLVDSEHIAGMLCAFGHRVEFDSEKAAFDAVIINTCGFIGDAKEESIDTILQYAELRKAKRLKLLVVFGCLVQRYLEQMREEIPEVDAFFGANDYSAVANYVLKTAEAPCNAPRRLSTPRHYAYLKISEGCDRRCSFCAIPDIRGRHVSLPIEQLVSQTEGLAAQGVKELIVIAQDTTCYGKDLYGKCALAELIERLAKVDGIEWIRLQYSYPNDFPQEVIDLMQREPKLCHYIDMPLQHINDRILHSMNRHITGEEIRSLIRRLREQIPDITLRTTLIVGYPGETREEFEQLKRFVEQTRFDRLGVFTYSAEEGTPSYRLADSVSEEEKTRRQEEIIDLQQAISLSLNQAKVGKTYEVIIDRREGDYWIGRTRFDSPEVDNEVLIPLEQDAEEEDLVRVQVTAAEEFDLYANIIRK